MAPKGIAPQGILALFPFLVTGSLPTSSRRLAEARFDRQRMMDAYEAAYLETMARPARPVGICA
jgi:hypothetical protein